MQTVYITRYWEKRGIVETEGKLQTSHTGKNYFLVPSEMQGHFKENECFTLRRAAVAECERKRKAKLKFLKEKLAKIQKMTFLLALMLVSIGLKAQKDSQIVMNSFGDTIIYRHIQMKGIDCWQPIYKDTSWYDDGHKFEYFAYWLNRHWQVRGVIPAPITIPATITAEYGYPEAIDTIVDTAHLVLLPGICGGVYDPDTSVWCWDSLAAHQKYRELDSAFADTTMLILNGRPSVRYFDSAISYLATCYTDTTGTLHMTTPDNKYWKYTKEIGWIRLNEKGRPYVKKKKPAKKWKFFPNNPGGPVWKLVTSVPAITITGLILMLAISCNEHRYTPHNKSTLQEHWETRRNQTNIDADAYWDLHDSIIVLQAKQDSCTDTVTTYKGEMDCLDIAYQAQYMIERDEAILHKVCAEEIEEAKNK